MKKLHLALLLLAASTLGGSLGWFLAYLAWPPPSSHAQNPPGYDVRVVMFPPFSYTHITGTTATVAKATGGMLHTVTVNTGAIATLKVFDLAAASCTGTPSTNVVASASIVLASLQTLTYDATLTNGICVQASGAMDVTVSVL
jgi:hypothetical protein